MDAFDDPYWRLLAVVAWVRRRDRDLVSVANASESAIRHLAARQLRWPNERPIDLEAAATDEPTMREEIEGSADQSAALDEIRRALQTGGVSALGRPVATDAMLDATLATALQTIDPASRLAAVVARAKAQERGARLAASAIPADEWLSLDVLPDLAGAARDDVLVWRDIRVRRDEVLALWPDPAVAPARSDEPDAPLSSPTDSCVAAEPSPGEEAVVPATARVDGVQSEQIGAAEGEGDTAAPSPLMACKDWLIGLMRGSERPRRKADLRTEARALFSVSVRTFDYAWASAVQETADTTWSRPGRRPIDAALPSKK